MTRPYAPGYRIPTDLLLQGLCVRRLSDGRERQRPGSLLGAAGDARHHSARRFHVPKSLSKIDPAAAVSTSASTPISQASSTPAPKSARSADRPGSTRRSAKPMSSCIERGHCHSVEAWREERLVGGLYGVTLGRAFFGESMFSRETDASKVCLVHLVERLAASAASRCSTRSSPPST